jgi:hypothetical protein
MVGRPALELAFLVAERNAGNDLAPVLDRIKSGHELDDPAANRCLRVGGSLMAFVTRGPRLGSVMIVPCVDRFRPCLFASFAIVLDGRRHRGNAHLRADHVARTHHCLGRK